MINHIWIGLVVFAIALGAYKDLSSDPANKTYKDAHSVELKNFDTVDDGDEYARSNEGEAGSSRALKVEWDVPVSGGDQKVPVNIVVEKPEDSDTPEEMQLSILGDARQLNIGIEVTDADGELFAATISKNAGELDEAKTVKFKKEQLASTTYDPEASLDYPITITGILISRGEQEASEEADWAASGVIYLDDLKANYPKEYLVSDSLKADRWMGVLTKSSTRWAEISISLAIDLIGIMMLWLGVMKIAEEAGLVRTIARMLKPIMVWLFPDIPSDGEAMGAIIMNISANMLGMGNAATPLGLKAMEELQEVNENKEYASNAMCMLLAMNTSSVTLITPAIIGYRAAAGSGNLMQFYPAMLGATIISTICAVTACKLLEKLPMFKIPPPTITPETQEEVAE
jgi:spore maturation protein A